jgi:hypothetical protein
MTTAERVTTNRSGEGEEKGSEEEDMEEDYRQG